MDHERHAEIEEQLYAGAIGQQVLNYVKMQKADAISELINSQANELVKKIWHILEDESLSDPECFYRIDEIVRVFIEYGIDTVRHCECE